MTKTISLRDKQLAAAAQTVSAPGKAPVIKSTLIFAGNVTSHSVYNLGMISASMLKAAAVELAAVTKFVDENSNSDPLAEVKAQLAAVKPKAAKVTDKTMRAKAMQNAKVNN